jgi:hypothetical protein
LFSKENDAHNRQEEKKVLRQVDHGVNILYETHMDLQADVLVGLDIRLGEAWSVALFYRQDKLVFITFESTSESLITVSMHSFSLSGCSKVASLAYYIC